MTTTLPASTADATTPAGPVRRAGRWIDHWDPEDAGFWAAGGQAVARRNLGWSVLAEFLGFCVWALWSVVVPQLNGVGFALTLDQQFWLDRRLFALRPDYLLRVQGDSMIDEGIFDGDLIGVHRTSDARNGQIVVARIDDATTSVDLATTLDVKGAPTNLGGGIAQRHLQGWPTQKAPQDQLQASLERAKAAGMAGAGAKGGR